MAPGLEWAKVAQPQWNSTGATVWTCARCAVECKPSAVFWGACAHQKCISRNDQEGHIKLEEPVKLCVLLVLQTLAAQVFKHTLQLLLLPWGASPPTTPTRKSPVHPAAPQPLALLQKMLQECWYKRDPQCHTGIHQIIPITSCLQAAQPSLTPRVAW